MNLIKHTAMVMIGFLCVAIIIGASAVLLDRHVNRGYCNATGDFHYSDHMKVLTSFAGLNSGDVLGKDGKKYPIVICPTMEVTFKPGDEITWAKYEYRNGCWDFTNPETTLCINCKD